ncbi:unnamed protein product [Cylicocyclus nassatus]|uniref:Uncharacterized protein n=1 Tax=Cylicocyclus nassatus TaxID=53992 RepID=A0AA36DP09_CYLNA|nr:unnamed protein product [Cylicocyclus nassatus]
MPICVWVHSPALRTDNVTVICPDLALFRCNEQLARHCMEQHSSTSDAQNITEHIFQSWDNFEVSMEEREGALNFYNACSEDHEKASPPHCLLFRIPRGSENAMDPQEQKTRKHKGILRNAYAKTRDNRWAVVCECRTDQVYKVRIVEACDCRAERNSHCERCNICAFRVCCNCYEAYQAGVCCIHAYALATFCEEVRQMFCLICVNTRGDPFVRRFGRRALQSYVEGPEEDSQVI